MTNAIVSLVYSLLIGKSTDDNNSSFEKIVKQGNFQFKPIMTDFETNTIKSVGEKPPNVLHKGMPSSIHKN